MAGFNFGNLLGGISSLKAATKSPDSVKTFLNKINKYGAQVKSNFEVTFTTGFNNDIVFFITSITTPGIKQNFAEIYYNGRQIKIPIVNDYDHEFNMTVINDGSGYLYSLITGFLMNESMSLRANPGYTMVIKGLTGDRKYNGITVTIRGVRFQNISGLSFGQNENDISTFDVTFSCIDFSTIQNGKGGKVGKISGVLNAVDSLLG